MKSKIWRNLRIMGLATAIVISSLPAVLSTEKSYSQAFAAPDEAKISKDKAIEIANAQVSIPADYILQNVSYNSRFYPLGHGAWSLQFTKKVQDNYYGNASVTVDADTGKVINFNINDNDPGNKPTYPPKVNLQGAKAVADKFLAAFNPDVKDQVTYNTDFEKSFKPPLGGDVQYYLRYVQTINGVAFDHNSINITVNGNGKVIGYDTTWDTTIKFDDKKDALTLEQAAKAYMDLTNITLNYITPYQAKPNTKPIITYNMMNFSLDAKTGKLINTDGTEITAPQDSKPLTDKPLADKPKENLNLTKEQAIAAVTSKITLPPEAKLQDASYNESTDNSNGNQKFSYWNLSWTTGSSKEVDKAQYIWATVNSSTGEITTFNRGVNYPMGSAAADAAKEPAVSLDKAKEQAIDYVKKILPQYSDQLVLDVQYLQNNPIAKIKSPQVYNFTFKRVIQGVYVENENVNIGINNDTGDLINLWSSISTRIYPEKTPDVISLDKAKELLFSQYTIELRYYYQDNAQLLDMKMKAMAAAGETVADTAATVTKPAQLVYQLVPKRTDIQLALDAATGNWINRDDGSITSLEKIAITDIDNHWARNELQLMVDYKALDLQDGKVLPNQSITRGELIKMLVVAMNGGYYGPMYGGDRMNSFADVKAESPYFGFVETAVDRNLIDRGSKNFNPDAVMKRDEMAELITRALGYNKLAQVDGLFSLNVKDKDAVKYKGQTAIMISLGIMTASDGFFHPEQEVTRAQAASAFSRYLQKRSELQDTPINYYGAKG